MNFTLRELEAFLGVARFGNFTRAARSLHMSQPALTVRIRHLEDALGVRLLDRTTRSVALTQVGREFLPVVERVLGEIDAVAVNARELAGKRRGLVTVAALPSIASTLLPATVAAFKTSHPGITVRLRDAVAQRVVSLVKSGEADFGIGSPTTRDPELRVSNLMDDPVCVAVPPGHPLERRERIYLEDLLESPLILMDREYSVRALIERAFHSIGRTVVPAYEASYVPTALGLVKAGLGIAVIDQFTVAHGGYPGVELLRIAEPTPFDTYIAVKRGASLSLHVEYFIDSLRSEMRALEPGRTAAKGAVSRGRRK